jgi:hypothetical protein
MHEFKFEMESAACEEKKQSMTREQPSYTGSSNSTSNLSKRKAHGGLTAVSTDARELDVRTLADASPTQAALKESFACLP